MKKNILLLLCVICSSSLIYQPLMSQDEQEVVDDSQEINDEQFDDFFGSSDDMLNQPERPKKEKWSRMRIIMVRLGVATVLGAQSFYAWLQSVWAYLTTWGNGEERKA